MRSRARLARRRMRGQSLVETAITLPVVLLLALGVTDLGRAFYSRDDADHPPPCGAGDRHADFHHGELVPAERVLMTKLQDDARWSLRPDYSGRPPRVPLPSASHRGRGEGWVRGGGQLSPPRFKRGPALVEVALMFPILFFLLALTLHLVPLRRVPTTLARRARQGARQAVANADPYDNPFG